MVSDSLLTLCIMLAMQMRPDSSWSATCVWQFARECVLHARVCQQQRQEHEESNKQRPDVVSDVSETQKNDVSVTQSNDVRLP
jgi:hypothetical protein